MLLNLLKIKYDLTKCTYYLQGGRVVVYSSINERLRHLPAVHTILDSDEGVKLAQKYGRDRVVDASHSVLELWRKKLKDNKTLALPDSASIIIQIREYLLSVNQSCLKRVINGTGIILHTNLGRAVLGDNVRQAVVQAACHYTNLEYNLKEGKRGSRYAYIEKLLTQLTGAEGALVVNNNAAGVLLTVSTLAGGKEAIVSRGELVEIGGSFRLPEVLKLGGAKLVEVGTTNRTYTADYRKVMSLNTAMILKVHTSNYRITGFTKAVSRKALVELAQEANIPLVEDLGSGSLLDLRPYGLKGETPVYDIISQGVDIVTFSGDKLLGGSQAGIILGKKKYLEAMKQNQLLRALRVDKLSLSALQATLEEYLNKETLFEHLPIYQMLTRSLETLKKKAQDICGKLGSLDDHMIIKAVPTKGFMGGGSLPEQIIPSWGIAMKFINKSLTETERYFRNFETPVIGYIAKDYFIIDLRTLLPGDEEIIIRGIKKYRTSVNYKTTRS